MLMFSLKKTHEFSLRCKVCVVTLGRGFALISSFLGLLYFLFVINTTRKLFFDVGFKVG